jgi:hypothetical protein
MYAPQPISTTTGAPEWKGVVMIERPLNADRNTLCRVTSARSLDLGGRRAIVSKLPYGMLAHFFTLADPDFCCVYAELKGEHLELLERASRREYFLTTAPAPLH